MRRRMLAIALMVVAHAEAASAFEWQGFRSGMSLEQAALAASKLGQPLSAQSGVTGLYAAYYHNCRGPNDTCKRSCLHGALAVSKAVA
jgi:hypothetical protein